MEEMQALMNELKEFHREAVRRKVFCSQCKVEGHVKEECTTTPTCAICVMYNHTTANYRYNMQNRAVAVNQIESHETQAAPPNPPRGRGGYRGRGQNRMGNRTRGQPSCYYCLVLGHIGRDCPLRLRHQEEKQAGYDKATDRCPNDLYN